METILLGILIVITLVDLAYNIAQSRLLVKIYESDRAKIEKFLLSRGLIDIPTTADYSNLPNDQRSSDMRYVRDN